MFKLSTYSENGYTVYRSVALKKNSLEAVDIIFITNIFFIFLIYET